MPFDIFKIMIILNTVNHNKSHQFEAQNNLLKNQRLMVLIMHTIIFVIKFQLTIKRNMNYKILIGKV
jgi:hypothetical protein